MSTSQTELFPAQASLAASELERSNLDDDTVIIRRDILLNGDEFAHLDLEYSTKDHLVSVETVGYLDKNNANKGFGKQLYEMVGTLPTPDNEKYTFISTGQSIEARHLWESFVRNNKAVKLGETSFKMLDSDQQ